MKNFKNGMINRIPWITLTFFICILTGAIDNIIHHNDPSGFCLFSVEAAVCCIGLYIVTYFVELFPFKSYTAFHVVNALSCYLLFMGCSYFFRFFGFRLSNIIKVTIEFLIFYTLISLYITYDYRRKSKQINDLLQKNQQ